jgi:hypothetical protein
MKDAYITSPTNSCSFIEERNSSKSRTHHARYEEKAQIPIVDMSKHCSSYAANNDHSIFVFLTIILFFFDFVAGETHNTHTHQ